MDSIRLLNQASLTGIYCGRCAARVPFTIDRNWTFNSYILRFDCPNMTYEIRLSEDLLLDYRRAPSALVDLIQGLADRRIRESSPRPMLAYDCFRAFRQPREASEEETLTKEPTRKIDLE
jgi:hypothetical protein